MRKAALTIFLGISALALGQSATLTDISAQGNPVPLRGGVVFSANSSMLTVTGYNNSTKEIIALAAKGTVVDTKGDSIPFVFKHDMYFKPKGFAAGSDFEMMQDELGPRENNGATPSLQAQVTFVQFVDGTTWGDSPTAQTMRADRKTCLSILNQLGSAYAQSTTSGDSILAQDQQPASVANAMVHHLRMIREQSGSAALIEDIKTRLARAASRSF